MNQSNRKTSPKKIGEWLMKLLFLLSALVSVLAVALISIYIFTGGIPAFAEIGLTEFLFGQRWKPSKDLYGILPMIVGSLYVTAGAILIGVPLGVVSAIFLARFCPSRLYRILKPLMELMSGIPSILYGFFGLVVLVPMLQTLLGGNGKGVLTASILLGIMILPTVITVSESALRAVPNAYYENALALGATHERAVYKSVLPAAKGGVFAGIVLGIGRAIGETMAVVMVAGNSAVIPDSLTSGVRTLTSNIILDMAYAADLHREALLATAVVLFVFVLLINTSFSLLKRRDLK